MLPVKQLRHQGGRDRTTRPKAKAIHREVTPEQPAVSGSCSDSSKRVPVMERLYVRMIVGSWPRRSESKPKKIRPVKLKMPREPNASAATGLLNPCPIR